MRSLRINILASLSQKLAAGTNTWLTSRKRPGLGLTFLKLLNSEYLGNRWKKCILHTFVHSWNIVTLCGISKKLLDAVHIEAARIVSGGTKLCSVDKLFQELGWEPLQIRRNKHKLVTFYKILHGLTPTYLLDIIPPHINETIIYPLRNADHFQNFRSNSNLFHESFFPLQ